MQDRQQNSPKFVPDTVAAQIIGSTPSTLRRWRHEGKHLAYHKIGRSVRYSVAALEEFLKQGSVNPESRNQGVA